MESNELPLESFDDVLAQVELLHGKGYESTGKWDLAQNLDHLSYFMKGAVDGYAFKVPWVLKAILGKMVLKRILSQRKMKRGVFTPHKPLPAPGGDETAAMTRFQETLRRFVSHRGEYQPSPFFGDMSREECLELNLIHCNHHLAYLTPKLDQPLK